MNSNILNLALDFYRSPSSHEELLDPNAPLPPEIGMLLEMLAADSGSENSTHLPEDLRNAIAFLIERVFYVPGGDHYRVLGLNQDASPEQIRKHYNQLLLIFFPDDRPEEWNPDYAMRLNRAYSTLRNPDKRRAYDQEEKHQTPAGVSRHPALERNAPEGHKTPSTDSKLSSAYAAPRNQSRDQSPLDQSRDQPAAEGKVNRTGNKHKTPPPEASPPPRAPSPPRHEDRSGRVEPRFNPQVPQAQPSSPRPPASSFIAHSVDRAYSSSEDPITAAYMRGDEDPLRHQSGFGERSGASKEVYPQGIPIAEEDVYKKRPEPSFFSNKLNLALLAGGIIVVVTLYVIMLPPMISDDATTGRIAQTQAPEPPREELGHVDRDEPPSEAPLPIEEPAPPRVAERDPPRPEPPASPAEGLQDSVGRQQQELALAPIPEPEARASTERDEPGREAGGPGSDPGADTAPELAEAVTEAESVAIPITEPEVTVTQVEESAVEVEEESPAEEPPLESATTGPSLPPAPVVDVRPARSVATVQELDNLAVDFARAYEEGDLDRMLSLFADNARTNERSDKAGIREDYEELFNITDSREFVIDGLRWQQGREGSLKGEGNFRVNVRFADDQSEIDLAGNVEIRVERRPEGIVITEFLHTYDD